MRFWGLLCFSSSNDTDCTEDRRPGRLKRGRRSPRPSTDDDSVPTPTITPTPSPSSTPEPLNQQQSESNGEATDGSTVLPGHTDQRRRQRLAATLQESNQQSTDERSGDEATEKPDLNVKPKPLNRQYSLIENYPPRERTVLTGCSSGGSDSGSGLSPPPIKPTPFIRHTNTQGPSRLTRLDSALPPTTPQRRQQTTVAASDLRTVSSLSEVDAKSNPKPTSTRTAITP
ncbi:hypothetical protein SK128_026443 [Halocaridina rubra]|uniref:Uncharacterized protein n=1 Tax=Halocaridina rubra TaxID=373956 RepID=A0AAN8WM74_HALRR